MPRFAKGEFRLMLAAQHEAYEIGSGDPLRAYRERTLGQIPRWAQHEIERNLYNIHQMQPRSGGHYADPDPPPELTVPAGSTIVDALVRVGPADSGERRTARVHLEGWMTDEDVIARVEQIVWDWSNKSGTAGMGGAATIEHFWRVR